MNPHTTTLWDVRTDVERFPPLREPVETEVVVIGGGITGATTALRLAEAGRRVVLVEARTVCSGATGASTAHGTEALDTRYHVLGARFGAEATRLVAISSRAAMDHIIGRVDAFAIACDLRRLPGYLYTEHPAKRQELLEELDAARAAGLRVTHEPQPALPFETAGAIAFPDQLRFDPRRYVLGLVRALLAHRVPVYEHTRVVELEEGDRVRLRTEGGAELRAEVVVCATHVPLDRATLQTRLRHQQTYVAAFRDVDLPDALFWDTERPYHYLRAATIGGDRYLVAGGADHATGTDDHTEIAFERLLAHCRARFGTDRPDFHWSSQIVDSIDGLPYIGRSPTSDRIYVATGLGGNGTTLGTVAALVVSDLVCGRAGPWADLYDARRDPGVGPSATREAAEAPLHHIGARMAPPDVESPAQIEPDQGRTLLRDGARLAVYRDRGGALHAVLAICTHMGCVVKFNDAERTWDCPCHGSRYTVDGEVLEGPAVQPLERRHLDDEAAPEGLAKSSL